VRLEDERCRAEVLVSGVGNGQRLVRGEHVREIRRDGEDLVSVTGVVDVTLTRRVVHVRIADTRVERRSAHVRGDSAPPPNAAERPDARNHDERRDHLRRVGIDGDEPPLGDESVRVRLVAVRRDRHVEPIADQLKAAPDVLVTRSIDQPQRPPGMLFARREVERMEEPFRADLVQDSALRIDHTGRAEAVRPAVVGGDGVEAVVPQDIATVRPERVHGAGLGRYIDHLLLGAVDRDAYRDGRGDDCPVELRRPLQSQP
jgi:hypothetical protein